MYATLSHSKLTTWEQVAAANGHNGRTIEVPNARSDGHPPVEMIERPGNDLTARMRGRLAEAGIKKLRANAVLAFEDIYGASPGYWSERYPDGWQNVPVGELMQDPLVRAVSDFAQLKHGADNVVSITWHLDEKTPHAHVVSMPIVTREHKRRGRKPKDGTEAAPVMKTTLAADQLRGGSKYTLEREHDDWAKFVAHLGLKRGKRGSDLSAEDRRDRRLRDRQASLEGERRAAEQAAKLKQTISDINFANKFAAEEQYRSVEIARSRAELLRASAEADAEKIRAKAELEAEALVSTAADYLREETDRLMKSAQDEAAQIKADAVRTRTATEAEAAKIREAARADAQERTAAAARTQAEASRILAAAQLDADRLRRAAEADAAALLAAEKRSARAEADKIEATAKMDRAAAAQERDQAVKHRQTLIAREDAIEAGLEAIAAGLITKGGTNDKGDRLLWFVDKQAEDSLRAKISPCWSWISKQAERLTQISSAAKAAQLEAERRAAALAEREAKIEPLVERLEKQVGIMRSILKQVQNAPTHILEWFKPAVPAVKRNDELSAEARAAIAARPSKGPSKPSEDDAALLAAYAAKLAGRGR